MSILIGRLESLSSDINLLFRLALALLSSKVQKIALSHQIPPLLYQDMTYARVINIAW